MQGKQLGEPQQTLSTQLPLMHWPPVVQARPFFLSAQLIAPVAPWQVKGARQSPSPVQVILQAFVPQTYGEQLAVVAVAQAPLPVQCETGEKVEPMHAAAHAVDAEVAGEAVAGHRARLAEALLVAA